MRTYGKKFIGAVLTAAVALGAGAGCESNAGNGALIGGAGGAGLGAVIGHQSGHAGEGALIGAVGGALVGGAIGNEKDKSERREREAYEAGRYDNRGGRRDRGYERRTRVERYEDGYEYEEHEYHADEDGDVYYEEHTYSE